MQLIWYNSIERRYEFGSSLDFKSTKDESNHSEAITILMEFTDEDGKMVNNIIAELNAAYPKTTNRLLD